MIVHYPIIGRVDIGWRTGWSSPKYFSEGMAVWVPWMPRKLKKAKIIRAHGNTAVVQDEYGETRWVELGDVAVRDDNRVDGRMTMDGTRGTIRSSAELVAEIAALQELRPKIRPRSMFGDDHLAAIDAQIEVLSEQMSGEKIYDRYYVEDERKTDVPTPESENILHNAMIARQWLDGDEPETPSSGWEALVEPVKKGVQRRI